MGTEKKPKGNFISSEYVGHPLATGLITSGVGILYAMPAGMGPWVTLAAGLGLVAAGTAVQLTYTLQRSGVKKALANAPQADFGALINGVLPAIMPLVLDAVGKGKSVETPAPMALPAPAVPDVKFETKKE
jgi:hypothetical protein